MTSIFFPKHFPALLPMILLAGSLFSLTTWNGSVSTDWNYAANWSNTTPF